MSYQWPETTQDTEQGSFTGTIGSGDQNVLALNNFKGDI